MHIKVTWTVIFIKKKGISLMFYQGQKVINLKWPYPPVFYYSPFSCVRDRDKKNWL